MKTTSTASQNARDTAERADEFGKARSASGGIEDDLQALRDDFTKLADQVGDFFAKRGDAVWEHARASVDGAVADVEAKEREAIDAVREVSDNFVKALDDSLKSHPYATVALIAGVAFIFGAGWRR